MGEDASEVRPRMRKLQVTDQTSAARLETDEALASSASKRTPAPAKRFRVQEHRVNRSYPRQGQHFTDYLRRVLEFLTAFARRLRKSEKDYETNRVPLLDGKKLQGGLASTSRGCHFLKNNARNGWMRCGGVRKAQRVGQTVDPQQLKRWMSA